MDSAIRCSALVSLGVSPVLSFRGRLEVCIVEESQTPLTTLVWLSWTICDFCDRGSGFGSAALDASDAFRIGAPLEALGLKKASRLPCGGGSLAEVLVTLLFFPFGVPDPGAKGLFFPKLLSAAPSGFKFSRFSPAS